MKNGFSLVELSIVLVILGLLVGGILAGQSLVRAAELRSVSTEYQRYVTAVHSFRDKYFALPGDMTNATSFWGQESGCSGSSTTASTGTATCNGDGNGEIWCPACNSAATTNEIYRSWQHLANAGLIEGSYTGVPSGTPGAPEWGWYTTLGVNAPSSKFPNTGWTLFWFGNIGVADVNSFPGFMGNALIFGTSAGDGLSWGAALKPEEAWNVDTKSDDGKPATGRVTSTENQGGTGTTNCSNMAPSTTDTLADSAYSLSNTGANCTLYFRNVAG